MLNLDNVDVFKLFHFFDICIFDVDKKVFEKLKIKTVGDLKKVMRKNPDFYNSFLYKCKTILTKTRKIERKYNLIPDTSSLFGDLMMLSKEDVETSEENTKGRELILPPVVGLQETYSFSFFLDLSVFEIKQLFYFQNALGKPLILEATRIGDKKLQTIIDAINLFDEQLIRQNEEQHPFGTDLFHLNYEEKKAIVLEEIESYITYLEENAKNCVWGPNDASKISYMRDALVSKSVAAIRNKERLINTFTNYFTLRELDNGIVKNKTLDRFIID